MPKLRLIMVDGDEQVGNISLQPPIDTEWLVIEATGWHDDVSNQSLAWGWIEYGKGHNQRGLNVVAGAIRVPITHGVLAEGGTISSPIILRHNVYAGLYLTTGSLGSGKKLHLRAFVQEYAGQND